MRRLLSLAWFQINPGKAWQCTTLAILAARLSDYRPGAVALPVAVGHRGAATPTRCVGVRLCFEAMLTPPAMGDPCRGWGPNSMNFGAHGSKTALSSFRCGAGIGLLLAGPDAHLAALDFVDAVDPLTTRPQVPGVQLLRIVCGNEAACGAGFCGWNHAFCSLITYSSQ
jgi:hypothetical protein